MEIVFFHLLGRLYLFLRYRNIEKRKAVLAEKYAGFYSGAGSDVILRPFALIGFLLMLVFIAAVIYGAIVHGIS
ncbi:hypothetical protein [Chitinophaga niabensis]|uniref:Uncharacterized protein n=1 Tax=Chitinophaga niabensis TaxID=536979 RepID=A0A1N6DYD7_9BACT|nr:hypothetical protein [Chitinophaga niabensis]SIN75762.1 hypothetical protein SAMN04488055_1171 [Chitinophaga niabensis]